MSGRCIVATWEDSIVLPYGSLSVMSFYIMNRAIFGVVCFARCMFAPGSVISSVCLLGELVGIPILFI